VLVGVAFICGSVVYPHSSSITFAAPVGGCSVRLLYVVVVATHVGWLLAG